MYFFLQILFWLGRQTLLFCSVFFPSKPCISRQIFMFLSRNLSIKKSRSFDDFFQKHNNRFKTEKSPDDDKIIGGELKDQKRLWKLNVSLFKYSPLWKTSTSALITKGSSKSGPRLTFWVSKDINLSWKGSFKKCSFKR